jgi:TRAP transporter TAXI family solute receptor
MKTNLRVVTLVMVMGAVGTCVSVAAAQSARRELSPGQGARTFPSAILKYREDLNRNTVTIISGTPAGTYLAVAYDMSAVLDDGDNLRVLAVAGKGSVQNVRDILHLRGVDMGIVQSDVMAFFKQNGELGANVEERLVYITKLYNEEMHLVANANIREIKDLVGKKVNFAEVGSGTQFSSRLIFGFLGIKVEEVNMGQTDALVKVKSGEIAATVFIAGRPASAFAKLPKDPGLKLLSVPYTNELEANDYFPSTLSSQDYPGLIPEGQSVDTIAVGAVLAVYNWPSNHDRHRRTANFIAALFGKFAEFQKPPRHPKWKEVNLAATLKGWKRFPTAQQWLDRAAAATPQAPRREGDQAIAQGAEKEKAEAQEKLFQRFLEWSKLQGKQ